MLGYSLTEISEFLNATVPEIKAALHRGRTRLRDLARNVETNAPILDKHEQELLVRYIDRFNARDFEGVRAMLADEVQLDLFGRVQLRGSAEVSNRYFYNYSLVDNWRLALGRVEGRSAILVYDVHGVSTEPAYFILITWNLDRISHIRDFLYARYVMQDARIGGVQST